MKASDFLVEHKKSRKAIKYNSKPRSPVAHAAQKVAKGSGPHKDKKAAEKRGEVKHKKDLKGQLSDRVKEHLATPIDEVSQPQQASITDIEAKLNKLEAMLPMVSKISKENHYVFEEIEAEVLSILSAAEELEDKSNAFDIKDAVEEAIQLVRQANAGVYKVETTLKDLIRSVNLDLEDARNEEEYNSRFNKTESVKFPMAGNYKQGPAGQLKGKTKRPAKVGDLVGGG